MAVVLRLVRLCLSQKKGCNGFSDRDNIWSNGVAKRFLNADISLVIDRLNLSFWTDILILLQF